MSVKKIVARQRQDKVNHAVNRIRDFPMCSREGWIRTVRTALGMSGTQLAKRLGVTKARISKVEHDEPAGRVTLKTMQFMAEAMDCQFVYAIVPKMDVEAVIRQRAIKKARVLVTAASTHMALEAQALDKAQLDFEIERIAAQIVDSMPADLWNE